MATANEIKIKFRSELYNAVSGIVDEKNVRVATNEKDAEYPSVVYDEFQTTGRTFLDTVERDVDGNITAKNYRQFVTIVFDCIILAETESQKDELVEKIREHFSRYSMWLDPIDFDKDCRRIEIQGTQNSDELFNNEIVRGDRLTIEVQFSRKQTYQP